jgi:hypothetical protein
VASGVGIKLHQRINNSAGDDCVGNDIVPECTATMYYVCDDHATLEHDVFDYSFVQNKCRKNAGRGGCKRGTSARGSRHGGENAGANG